MILFRTCCFCFPLRIGCFIIGYVHMAYHVIEMILSIMLLISGVQLSKLDPQFVEVANMLIASSAITIFFLSVFIIFTFFLLYGLQKERRGYVKAFLIYNLIFLIAYMILFFVSLGYGSSGIWNIILGFLEIFFGIYFLLVIRSQYVEMDNTHNNSA